MRRTALIGAGLAVVLGSGAQAAPAASAPRAELMVVGQERVLRDARTVRMATRRLRVDGGRRCAVGARTPLGVLAGAGLRLRVRDYGACGRRTRDATGLYVAQVGRERERGRGGWVYKVGTRAGTGAAGDPAGPFGRGGLRRGARVLWFWCELGSDGCQRTLSVRPSVRSARAGQAVGVRVRAHDDRGRSVPAAGATVRLGPARAVTGSDGRATLPMPAGRRAVRLTATLPGAVRSFPERLRRR